MRIGVRNSQLLVLVFLCPRVRIPAARIRVPGRISSICCVLLRVLRIWHPVRLVVEVLVRRPRALGHVQRLGGWARQRFSWGPVARKFSPSSFHQFVMLWVCERRRPACLRDGRQHLARSAFAFLVPLAVGPPTTIAFALAILLVLVDGSLHVHRLRGPARNGGRSSAARGRSRCRAVRRGWIALLLACARRSGRSGVRFSLGSLVLLLIPGRSRAVASIGHLVVGHEAAVLVLRVLVIRQQQLRDDLLVKLLLVGLRSQSQEASTILVTSVEPLQIFWVIFTKIFF